MLDLLQNLFHKIYNFYEIIRLFDYNWGGDFKKVFILPFDYSSWIINKIIFSSSSGFYFINYNFFVTLIIIILVSLLYFLLFYLIWNDFHKIFNKKIIKKEISDKKANYYLIFCPLVPYLWLILAFIIWLKYKISYSEFLKKVLIWLLIKSIIYFLFRIYSFYTNYVFTNLKHPGEVWEFNILNEYFLYDVDCAVALIIIFIIPFLIFTMSSIYYFLISKKSNN